MERAAAQAEIDRQLAEMKVFPVLLPRRGHNRKPVLFCLSQAKHVKDLADLAAGVYVPVFVAVLLLESCVVVGIMCDLLRRYGQVGASVPVWRS